MRHRRATLSSSSNDDTDGPDAESCFDTEDEKEGTDAGIELADVDADVDGWDEVDLVWIAGADNVEIELINFDQY